MKKKLPIFEFIIGGDEDGVTAISIVDDPAFQSSLVTFSKNQTKFVELADANGKKKKKICAGLSLIPNVLVYRVDPVFGEYFGYFSAETIERIVEKYHEELNNNKVNLNHDPDKYIDAFMVSDYIVDSEEKVADLKRLGIEHENIIGSWFTAFKIKDDQIFEQIVNGNAKTGFSIEAFLDTYLVQAQSQINNNKIKSEMKKQKKSVYEKILDLFKKEMFERMLVPELGFEIEWSEVGQPVNKVDVDEEGNETMTPVGAGEFKTDSGVIVVDESSNLVEVRELPEEPEEVAPEPEAEVEMPEIELPEEEEAPVEEAPVEEPPMEEPTVEEAPVEEIPVEEVPVADVRSKTIGEVVGQIDGEYWIKVVVEGGQVTEAEVSGETDLLKTKVNELESEVEKLSNKLKEPIGEPILEAPIEKKEWAKMSAYERALHKARQ